jgi:hypothetical protein
LKKIFPAACFLLLVVCCFPLQGCSWICRFFIANTTNEPVIVEIKLMDSPGSFPIFHYPKYYYGKLSRYELKKGLKVNFEKAPEEVKADTMENFSHFRFEIPPHTAIEIGQLQNDHYEKHDQYFINGRVFNFEKLVISRKKIEITPPTFDNYFKKGKYSDIYFVL